MPIRIQCDCGKTLTVADAKAGLRCRCPACQKVHDIPKPAAEAQAPPAEDLICARCGAVEPPSARRCAQCGADLHAKYRVIEVKHSSSILDAAPMRWIADHKLLLAGCLAASLALVAWRSCSSPGSAAYDQYHRFADLVEAGEMVRAREMAEGDALKQLDVLQGSAMAKQVTTSRTVYTLISETFSDSGTVSTIRLTQQYWTTVPGSLQTVEQPMERDHTARVVLRDGKWIVSSFEMGPPRKKGEAAEGATATTVIRVDAAGCGVTSATPLGTFKLVDLISAAGLTAKQPEEKGEADEAVQTRPFAYQLRAKEGGSWPEKLEIDVDIDGEVRAVRAEFRLAGAPGTPLEESRVARFAADYWNLLLGAAPAFDAQGGARAERGDVEAEWRKQTAATRESVEFRSKKAGRSGDESLWPQSRPAHASKVCVVGTMSTGEPFTAGQDGQATTHRITGFDEKLPHPGPVTSAVPNADGLLLFTGCSDGKVRVWRRAGRDTKFQTSAEWLAHAGGVGALAMHPGGDAIASGGEDGTVKLWDAASRELLATMSGHKSAVTSVAFRPDGSGLASAGKDGTVRLWDAKGAAQRSIDAHSGGARSIAFHPDGRLLASAGADGVVKVWNVRTGNEAASLRGHEGPVDAVLFTHHGRALVSGGSDRRIRMWNLATREPFLVLRCFGRITCLSAAEENTLTAGGDDGLVRTWSLWNLKLPAAAAPKGDGEPPTRTLALEGFFLASKWTLLSPNGRTLALARSGSDPVLWDPATGKRRPAVKFGGSTMSVALSDDGAFVAGCLLDKSIAVVETESGRETARLRGGKTLALTLAVSRDGKRVAGSSRIELSFVQVWDVAGGAPMAGFDLPGGTDATRLAFTPDGRFLAVGLTSGVIRLVDAASGKRARDLTGHEGAVTDLAFSDDGALLVSGGADASVRVWRMSDGTQAESFRGHSGPVASVAPAPGGKRIASAAQEILVWEVGSEAAPRLLGKSAAGLVAFAGDAVVHVECEKKGEVRIWERK